jgi:hypothetical protein
MNGWFIIRAADGWAFRVSINVAGIGQFLEQCERHLKPAVLASAKKGYSEVGRPFP